MFAFPGRVTDEFSAGCNALIKNNKAALIESAADLIKFMSWENKAGAGNAPVQTALFVDLTSDEQNIISILRQQQDGLQMNELAVKMEKTLPNACCIAMTGTPLMKKDKSTANKFGGMIKPVYTVDQAH